MTPTICFRFMVAEPYAALWGANNLNEIGVSLLTLRVTQSPWFRESPGDLSRDQPARA